MANVFFPVKGFVAQEMAKKSIKKNKIFVFIIIGFEFINKKCSIVLDTKNSKKSQSFVKKYNLPLKIINFNQINHTHVS